MLKLVGMLIFLSGILLVCRELTVRRKRRLAICEELGMLISHIRLQIGCFLRPLDELLVGYSSDLLEETGFLRKAKNEGLSAAFRNMKASLPLTKEEKAVIERLFSSLGAGYMQDEIKLIDAANAEFNTLLERNRASLTSDIKLHNTLLTAAAIGLVIFLV